MSKGIGGHTLPCNGRTNDWITPRFILDALGDFDLDPCACEPQPWPTAHRMLTRHDNGLMAKWEGRVWLNPPYGQAIGDWMCRMADHNHGTALVFARTETSWFRESVWGKASGLLFLHGRLHFCLPDGTESQYNAGGPTVLIAYGPADAIRLRACEIKGAFVNQIERA
jgi:hypothetical protein